jgi:hypothetical protein
MAVTIDGSASVTINSGAILGITSGTAVASTSGTSIDFTSIPSWVKRITVMLSGVSTNGTSQPQIQIGSGSFTTSGYSSAIAQTNSNQTTSITTGLRLSFDTGAAHSLTGVATFYLLTGSTYVGSSVINRINDGYGEIGSTTIALSGACDRIRLTTTNGTDTFDAGTVNILYE